MRGQRWTLISLNNLILLPLLKCMSGAFFFSFYGCTCSIWQFPGYGSSQSYSCRPMPRSQQRGIQAMSLTYTTAHDNSGSLTHRARAGIKPTSSWILVRFVTRWTTTGIPKSGAFFNILCRDVCFRATECISMQPSRMVRLNWGDSVTFSKTSTATINISYFTVMQQAARV